MKKVLSLVLALTLVLGMIPVFAAETGTDKLIAAGFVNGNNPEDVLTREQLAVLVTQLNGEEAVAEAVAWVAPLTFADADKITWSKGYVGYAVAEGWMGGKPGNMFDPQAPAKPQEVAAVLLNALEYQVGKDVEYANVLEFAAGLGLNIAAGTQMTRGEAFEAMWVAVAEVPMNTPEGKTLGVVLGKLTEEEPEAPTALEVADVVADNARQVKVEFNQAVTEASLTATNVKIYRGTSTSAEAFAVSLSEDGMVATFGLTANSMTQDSNVKVVIKDVVAAADATMKLAEYTETLVMKDTTSPTVLSATFETSKTIKITLSEPLSLETNAADLHVLENILINGNKLVGKIVQDYSANTLTVTLGAKLPVAEHKIKVTGYRDFAGWLAADAEFTASVIEDKTAPKVVSVDAGRTSVKVTFDEAVASIGTLTLNGATYTTGTTTDNKTFKITLNSANYLSLASLIQQELAYYGTTDMEGNVAGTAAAPVKFVFVANDDTVAPTATIELDANNNIIITFSEEMSNPGKVKVQKADGTTVASALVPTVKTAATFKYQVTAAAAGLGSVSTAANYTVTLTDAKDNSVRENALASTVVSVPAKDIVKPYAIDAKLTQVATTKVENSVTVEDKKAQITIFFSEAMDVASITEVNNYTVSVGGTAAPINLGAISGVTLSAAADAKSVVITFPGTGTNGTTPGATTATDMYVLLVKDAAGNTMETTDAPGKFVFNEEINAAGTAAALALDDADGTLSTYGDANVVMTATNQIKVGFNNPMSIIDPSEFVVYKTGTTTGVQLIGVSYTLSSNSKVATITLNSSLTGDGKVDGAPAILFVKANGNTKDMFGNKITANAYIDGVVAPAAQNALSAGSIADYVAPTFTKVEKDATAKNTLVFTFSEPVTSGSFNAEVLIKDADGVVIGYANLGGGDTENAVTNTMVVRLGDTILAALEQGTNDIKVSIPNGSTIVDANGNKLAPLADTATTIVVDTVGLGIDTATTTQTSATNVMLAGTKQFTVTMTGVNAGAFGNSIGVEIVAANLGGSGTVATGVTAAVVGGNLRISLDNNAGAAAYTVQSVITAINAVPGFTAAISGSGALATALAATDTEATGTTATAGGQDVVVVNLTEAYTAANIDNADANSDFAIDSTGAVTFTATTAETDADTLTITITAANKQVKGANINVKAAAITDLTGNANVTTAKAIQ